MGFYGPGHLSVPAIAEITRLTVRVCMACEVRWTTTCDACWSCGEPASEVISANKATLTYASPMTATWSK